MGFDRRQIASRLGAAARDRCAAQAAAGREVEGWAFRVRNEVPEMWVGLYAIRQQIEEGFEVTGAVDDEVRGVAARNSRLTSLAANLPPAN